MLKGGLLIIGAALLLSSAVAQAQPNAIVPLNHLPALAGDYFPISSSATGRTYHIYVSLPESYAREPERRYPIVYLLDGDSAFPLLAPQHLFMTYDDKAPEAIIIGIAYGSFDPAVNKRHIDFDDGAAAFQRFLKQELIPVVERRVRAAPNRRVLVGQSRGGGFVLYSAFTDPGLFWGRIASNPAMQSYKAMLMGQPPQVDAAAATALGKLAVVSGTNDRPALRSDALAWFAAHHGKPAAWTLKRIDLEGGTHAADMPNAYRKAMNWLFDGER